MPQFQWLRWYCSFCYWTEYEDKLSISFSCQMHLLSDVIIKVVINDLSYSMYISLTHVRSWCGMHFIFIDWLFFLFFFSIIYNLQKKNDLLFNATLKIGCKNKWKFMLKICLNSFLVTIHWIFLVTNPLDFGSLRIFSGCYRSTIGSWMQ